MKIVTSANEEEKENFILQKNQHLQYAEKARLSKEEAKTLACKEKTTVSFCFDLQKTLPTPVLTCGEIFYLRQMACYNLCIHNLESGQASMHLWHEGQARRGSQEIISCLLNYLERLPKFVKKIVAFSDNCGGQNKNKNIIKFWLYVISNTQIETVEHKFLVSGHSFMECDQNFGVIEKKKKTTGYVFAPKDWARLIKNSSKKFNVIEMQQKDFVSIENFGKNLLINQIKGIRNFSYMRFEKKDPYKFWYKCDLEEESPFTEVNLKSKGRPANLSNTSLNSLYKEPIPIHRQKYQNLQSLLKYLPLEHHEFYKNLKYSDNSKSQSAQKGNEENSEFETATDLESNYE